MAIKQYGKNGKWMASYYKRHPITKLPVRRTKKNLKSQAEAKREYDKLVVKVDELLKEAVTPKWPQFLDQYFAACKKRDNYTKNLFMTWNYA